MAMSCRAALGALLLSIAAAAGSPALAAETAPVASDLLALGRALYLEGRRADGSPLVATRTGGLSIAGPEAACGNCHRRSGMGGTEGRSYIPPVTAHALFTAMPSGRGPSALGDGRPAYTEASLAQALREGVDASGRTLDFLMPRYRLQDQEVKALQAYLLTLPQAPVVGDGVLHFATVVAPDVPRERSDAMLGVLQACFDEHNAGPQPERGRKKLAFDMRQREGRKWQLHVWPLQGPQESWQHQLAQHAGRQPVFALVGGIGARWQPVHGFCEASGVPCLFPQVEAPVIEPAGFYPVYLGKGALLEAGLIAQYLGHEVARPRVTQVLREHDAGAEAAADALQRSLAEHGIATRTVRVRARALLNAGTFPHVRSDEPLVLWLRREDLRSLDRLPPAGSQVFVSATLAQQDDVPLPAAWKARTLMAYPFELPQRRAVRVAALAQWLQSRGLPLTDERVQGDAWVACKALGTSMMEAQDHLGRDYLLERLESNMERSTATGLYPRLSLGIGQRFASKTGYLVRFDEAGAFVAIGERTSP
jgi:mono/diheme cytochrome c family protein